MNNTTTTPTADDLAIGIYYIATDYGIEKETPENISNTHDIANSNTKRLQDLVDKVSLNGGGTIYFPVGTYCFGIGGYLSHKYHIPYAVEMKSNVSIIGENMEKTILKQICAKKDDDQTPQSYSLFVYLNSANEPKLDENGKPVHPETFVPITGCTYSNFTVDASETAAVFDCNEDGSVKNPDHYPYYAKAFYYQFVKDCVFRDLILRDTIATALGIDYLDRVQIENIYCHNCGRGYVEGATGSAGIGIGTGGWDNENFYIHNCTCVESGQFGIFIENQLYLGWGPKHGCLLPKGCIISNCITRNGRKNGFGIRGGQYVTVIGCESYENAVNGIYVDGYCKNAKICNCNFAANQAYGIYVDALATDLVIMNNHVKGNKNPLFMSEQTYADCVIKNNIFFGTIEDYGTYIGNLYANDLLHKENYLSIPYSEFTENQKLLSNGSEETSSLCMTTNFLDVSHLSGSTLRLGYNDIFDAFRIAQYDAEENCLDTPAELGMLTPWYSGEFHSTFDIPKKENVKYIRVFIDYHKTNMTQDFFLSVCSQ